MVLVGPFSDVASPDFQKRLHGERVLASVKKASCRSVSNSHYVRADDTFKNPLRAPELHRHL